MSKHPKFLLAAIFLFACLEQTQATMASELNIYSHRQPFLIKPFLQAFTEKTGIKTNVVYASKGLVQRLLAEGEASPADIVLTVDIGRLRQYADKNLFAPFTSDKLLAAIPRHLRSSDNTWFGFSKRSRVIAVSKDLENQDQIKRFENIADKRWKGLVCSRPGSHVYNRALLSSIMPQTVKLVQKLGRRDSCQFSDLRVEMIGQIKAIMRANAA